MTIPPDPRRLRDLAPAEARDLLRKAASSELRYLEGAAPGEYEWRDGYRVGPVRAVVFDLGDGQRAAVVFLIGNVRNWMSAQIVQAEEVRA